MAKNIQFLVLFRKLKDIFVVHNWQWRKDWDSWGTSLIFKVSHLFLSGQGTFKVWYTPVSLESYAKFGYVNDKCFILENKYNSNTTQWKVGIND